MIAIIIGATGLIGKQLVKQLLADELYTDVKIFVRRSSGISNPKLTEFIINFEHLNEHTSDIVGDVLFSVLGTTLKTAGSKDAQYKIDYGYQIKVAEIAADNGVSQLVLLSSIGADHNSNMFYTQMKGKLDEDVRALSFESISIHRPSMLEGNRTETRWTETIFTPIMKAAAIAPCWKKYRPIKDAQVAKAMRRSVLENDLPYFIYESNAMFLLANMENKA